MAEPKFPLKEGERYPLVPGEKIAPEDRRPKRGSYQPPGQPAHPDYQPQPRRDS